MAGEYGEEGHLVIHACRRGVGEPWGKEKELSERQIKKNVEYQKDWALKTVPWLNECEFLRLFPDDLHWLGKKTVNEKTGSWDGTGKEMSGGWCPEPGGTWARATEGVDCRRWHGCTTETGSEKMGRRWREDANVKPSGRGEQGPFPESSVSLVARTVQPERQQCLLNIKRLFPSKKWRRNTRGAVALPTLRK